MIVAVLVIRLSVEDTYFTDRVEDPDRTDGVIDEVADPDRTDGVIDEVADPDRTGGVVDEVAGVMDTDDLTDLLSDGVGDLCMTVLVIVDFPPVVEGGSVMVLVFGGRGTT